MMGSSSGSGSRYLDPNLVYELIIRRMPRELLDYMDSIPGTSRDLHCHQVVLYGRTLLTLVSRPPRLPLYEVDRRILCWAELAWFHATNSRFCAPRMIGNPSNFPSDAGRCIHPHNSSSYSGRMLTHEPHMHNQLSASDSMIYAATFPQLWASSSDRCVVTSFSTRRAGIRDETSASNSGTHPSAYVPLRDHSMLAIALEGVSDGCFSDVIQAQVFAELSPDGPGSEQFTPQMLMRNTEDIKGKRPALEADQIKAKILRLNVASVITPFGRKSAAGVLIRDGSTAQFMSASCFRPICMDQALLFAIACCEGIGIAVSYEPTTIVLESHLVPLLEQLVHSQAAEALQLNQLLSRRPPDFIIRNIPEVSNGAARQLVDHAFQMKESNMVYKDPPDWLVPYLDQ